MKKTLLLLFVMIASASAARGQGFFVHDVAFFNSGGFAKVVPNALVKVCSDGPACAVPVTLYANVLLTIPIGTSTNADVNGNYQFYIAPGTYAAYQVSGVGMNTLTFTNVTFPCTQGSSCAGGGGGGANGTINNGPQYGIPYYLLNPNNNTIGNVATPPNVNGQYIPTYNISGNTPGPFAYQQAGFGGRAILGSATTDLVAFGDNETEVDHDQACTAAVNQSLPTPATLQNTQFAYNYSNQCTFQDTITPVTYTINGKATLTVPPGAFVRIKIDPANPATDWLADITNASTTGSGAGPYSILTDGATVTWAVAGATASNAEVTLGGNRTLSITGAPNGWEGTLIVNQDGTGSRTLTPPAGSAVVAGGAGVLGLTTTANAQDKLQVTYDGTKFYWDIGKNYTTAGAGTWTVVHQVAQNSNSCNGLSTCTLTVPATTAGNLITVFAVTATAAGARTFSSGTIGATSLVGSGPCGNNFTTGGSTTSSICAYALSAPAGATTVSFTINATSTVLGLMYQESHWSGSSITFDTSGSPTPNASCTSCAGVALTLAGSTDIVVQLGNPGNQDNSIAGGTYGNFLKDTNFFEAIAAQLNSNNGAAPTWTQGATASFHISSAMAFIGH